MKDNTAAWAILDMPLARFWCMDGTWRCVGAIKWHGKNGFFFKLNIYAEKYNRNEEKGKYNEKKKIKSGVD